MGCDAFLNSGKLESDISLFMKTGESSTVPSDIIIHFISVKHQSTDTYSNMT